MAVQQMFMPAPATAERQELLRSLLEAPPDSGHKPFATLPPSIAPDVPRSDPQRPAGAPRKAVPQRFGAYLPWRHAPAHRTQGLPASARADSTSPDWLDNVLQRIQRALLVGAVALGVYWFANGALYDWIHEWRGAWAGSRSNSVTVVIARNARQVAAQRRFAMALSAAAPAVAYDFIAPGHTGLVKPVELPAPLEPTHMLIPSIGLDAPVKQVFVVDGEWEEAEYAAGYMYGTGLPGNNGNMAISGHAGLRGGVFRDLPALAIGADVFVDAGGWRYHYRINASKVVWPTQIEVLYPTENATLTLITCTNWDLQRLIVTGDLIGSKPLGG